MNRVVSWLGAAMLLVIAGVAVATAPQEGTLAAPFRVVGEPGDVITTRSLTVEVKEVRIARELDLPYDSSGIRTGGVWVIVDAVITPSLGTVSTTYAGLVIGDVTYRVESLPYPSLERIPYGAGVPVRGSLAFEVPESALNGADRAEVWVNTKNNLQLDSVAVVIIDLSAVPVDSRAIIDGAFVVGIS